MWGGVGILSNIEKSRDFSNLNSLRSVNYTRGLQSLGLCSTTPSLSENLVSLNFHNSYNILSSFSNSINSSSST